MMKAVVFDKRSPVPLVYCDVEKPVPQAGQVLVKVHAVSINAADYRSMQLGIIPKNRIYGADIAGTVEALGDGVTQFKVGDAVAGDTSGCGFGGFAEYAAAKADILALKPATISYRDASAIPLASVTALQGLRDLGGIAPGKKVLIYGAGGGVGNYAVQLAKAFGALVTAVCGPSNVELIRSLGADTVIDYTRQDFRRMTETYDLILGVNGSQPLAVYRRALAPGGVYVMAGGSFSQVFAPMLFGWAYSTGGRKFRFLAARPNAKDLEYVLGLVQTGKVKVVIDKCYPLEKTAEAVSYIKQGHTHGKVVVEVIPA
jgi:NADPH:quinone reductase-like Zn-dependent oxidoreductase